MSMPPPYQPGPPPYQPGPPPYQPGPPPHQPGPAGHQPGPAGYQPGPAGYQQGPAGYQQGPPQQTAAMYVPLFLVKQRITLMINRYEILAVNPDGSEGGLLALAEQKRMQLKEEVIFFADQAKTRRVFSFKARQRLDVHAQHDVFDERGVPLGMFSKEFGASLLRSTWHLSAPGLDALGQERRPFIAVLRRIWTFLPYVGDVWVPFIFHFDFVDKATGHIVLVSERQRAVRDRYSVSVPDQRVDFRVAAAMAVALDALQSR